MEEVGGTGPYKNIFEWVSNHPDIRDIYLVGRWLAQYGVQEGLANLGEKGKIKPYRLDAKTAQKIEADFRRAAQWFIQHKKRVFIFSCVPEYNYAPCDIMARKQIIPFSRPIEITREDYGNRQRPIADILRKLQSEGLITVVPLESGLLSGGNTVFMGPDGTAYYRDANHLTPQGAYHACEVACPFFWSDDSQKTP